MFVCPSVPQVLREKLFGKALLKDALASSIAVLFNRALLNDMSELCSAPSSDMLEFNVGLELASSGEPGEFFAFSDGSATQHPIQEARRAGWGVVFASKSGSVVGTVCGTVPRPWPQTSFVAEWFASLVALQHARGTSTTKVLDCMSIVNLWSQAWSSRLASSSVSAGFFRFALQFQSQLRRVSGVLHTKAHRSADSAQNEWDRLCIDLNAKADELADEGRKMHDLTPCEGKSLERALLEGTLVAKGAAHILHKFFEEVPVAHLSRGSGFLAPPSLSWGHDWHKAGKLWACSVCGVRTKRRFHTACLLKQPFEKGFGTGHHVVQASLEGQPFFFCVRCGCHGSWRFKGLWWTCQGAAHSPVQRHVLRMLLLARHPRSKIGFEVQRRVSQDFASRFSSD